MPSSLMWLWFSLSFHLLKPSISPPTSSSHHQLGCYLSFPTFPPLRPVLLTILLKFQALRQFSDPQSLPCFNSFEGLEAESLEALNGRKVIQGLALGVAEPPQGQTGWLFNLFFFLVFFLKKYDMAPKNSGTTPCDTLKPQVPRNM